MVSSMVILPTFFTLLTLLVSPNVGQALVHTAVLDTDGKFHISWDFTDTEITFEVTVKTRGYFGLGFSPSGGMAGSDIVIGWVDDFTGQGHLSDRHAVGNSRPIVDKTMDYIHQMSFQNETQTTLRFSRPLELCAEEDYSITGIFTFVAAIFYNNPRYDTIKTSPRCETYPVACSNYESCGCRHKCRDVEAMPQHLDICDVCMYKQI